MGFDPYYDGINHRLKRTYPVPQYWWCCTEPERVADNFQTLLSFIPNAEIKRVVNKPQHQRVELVNGSWAQMKSYGMKRRAFQGASLHGIWNDEEEDETINIEQEARLIDHDGVMIRTMTAVEGTTWLYDGPLLGLGDTKEGKKCFERQRGRMSWFTGKMRDNPHLSEEAIEEFIASVGLDEDEYLIRVEGGYRLLAGENAFGSDNIHWAYSTAIDAPFFGTFDSNGVFFPSEKDHELHFRVWKPVVEGHSYAIGADPAKGTIDSDDSAICVKEVLTGEDVATFAGRVNPNDFAKLIVSVGRHYNDAFLVIESNSGWGSAVLTAARELGYPIERFYHRQSFSGRLVPELDTLGWHTGHTTKPKLVHDLRQGLSSKVCVVRDEDTVKQMGSYVQLKKNLPGYHGFGPSSKRKKDDRVIAQALAWQGCRHTGIFTDGGAAERSRNSAVRVYEMLQARKLAMLEDDIEIDLDTLAW